MKLQCKKYELKVMSNNKNIYIIIRSDRIQTNAIDKKKIQKYIY